MPCWVRTSIIASSLVRYLNRSWNGRWATFDPISSTYTLFFIIEHLEDVIMSRANDQGTPRDLYVAVLRGLEAPLPNPANRVLLVTPMQQELAQFVTAYLRPFESDAFGAFPTGTEAYLVEIHSKRGIIGISTDLSKSRR
jgi:hypothetical protein